MKKLRFLLLALMFVAFATGSAFAQDNKTQYCGSYEISGTIVCSGEYVWGEVSWCVTNWEGKIQIKYKGIYYGEFGNVYTWSSVRNSMWKDYVEGQAYNKTMTVVSSVECNGEPMAIIKLTTHLTINAQGVVTADFTKGEDSWTCL